MSTPLPELLVSGEREHGCTVIGSIATLTPRPPPADEPEATEEPASWWSS